MKIKIIRGANQIGGIAVEISTEASRIIIDMGDELSLDPGFIPRPMDIPGVTDDCGECNGVFITHYHGDHVGQISRVREGIPIYAGALTKDVMKYTAERRENTDPVLLRTIERMQVFSAGVPLNVGDIVVTPYFVDHSACESFMFLIEADGKRVLYTGDFRAHGFKGKGIAKLLRQIGSVNVLVIEGTCLSRDDSFPCTERELQQSIKRYLDEYKYVFVLSASTNLERIAAFSKAVPPGKYFLCDGYQKGLLLLSEKHLSHLSPLFSSMKCNVFGENIRARVTERGFLMTVRDNKSFRDIITSFDASQSIILYSMWDGYRHRPDSTLPEFLALTDKWESLHTSGHASREAIRSLISAIAPRVIIPMHTDSPSGIKELCGGASAVVLNDGDSFEV